MIYVAREAGLCRRPYVSIREARQRGRPRDKYTVKEFGRQMHSGCPIVYNWEARRCGRPSRKLYKDGEASLCRGPHWVYKGSSTKREAP